MNIPVMNKLPVCTQRVRPGCARPSPKRPLANPTTRSATARVDARLGLALVPPASQLLALMLTGALTGPCGSVVAADPLDGVDPASLRGGLVVLTGQTDLSVATRLARTGRFIVHQLVPADQVQALRVAALTAGMHGSVCVGALPADGQLAHPSRFADVVVADLQAPLCPSRDELLRVTNVHGKLLLGEGGAWKLSDRPKEAGIADWSHKWHDATGHQLSADTKAGPPMTVQWQAGPAFADGAAGGIHPIIAEGAFACMDAASQTLAVRSAGSGLVRWRSGPTVSGEFLISAGKLIIHADPKERYQRVFGKLEAGPLYALDLATGQGGPLDQSPQRPIVPPHQLPGGVAFNSAVADGSTLLACAEGELAALDLATGQRRWHAALDGAVWFAPRIAEGLAIAAEVPAPAGVDRKIMGRGRYDEALSARAIAAFSLADGKPAWRVALDLPRDKTLPSPANLKPLICAGGMVLVHTSSYQCRAKDAAIFAFDIKTGQHRWTCDLPEGGPKREYATDSATCVLFRDGEVLHVGGHGSGGVQRIDPATGQTKGPRVGGSRHFSYSGECSMSRGTVNWLNKAAVTWYGKDLTPISRPAVRSSCGSGVFPAQGMVFAVPTGCDCTGYARGYLGMACEPDRPVADDQRLARGSGKPGSAAAKPGDWPVFLADNQRRAASSQALPGKLVEQWSVAAAPKAIDGPLLHDRRRDEYWIGALTAPTIAADMVFVGMPDAQAVAAVNAATGALKWRMPVGGPVDTPPTIAGGLAVFGCQDGSIYALSTDDGALVWTFNGALGRRLAMLNGRLTSAHPAPGSVLVADGKVYATVGYHAYLGGIAFYVLDLATGRPLAGSVRSEMGLDGTLTNKDTPNLLNDILMAATDGGHWINNVRMAPDASTSIENPYNTKLPQPITMNRRCAIVAFTHGKRGGSTHGWNVPTAGMGHSGFWLATDGGMVYTVNANSLVAVQPKKDWREKIDALWTAKLADAAAGSDAVTALIKAGDRLYLGCGSYLGDTGLVVVINATDGQTVQKIPVPARVAPGGLAAAHGRLVVTCVDGTVLAFGG